MPCTGDGQEDGAVQKATALPAALDEAVLSAGTLAAKLAGFCDGDCHERTAIWRQKPQVFICCAQVTGKKMALFNRPLHVPAALDEVVLSAESLAVSQAPSLLSKLSMSHLSTIPGLPEEMARQASDPITISRKSSGKSG